MPDFPDYQPAEHGGSGILRYVTTGFFSYLSLFLGRDADRKEIQPNLVTIVWLWFFRNCNRGSRKIFEPNVKLSWFSSKREGVDALNCSPRVVIALFFPSLCNLL